jgi:hypothetical protein
MPVRGRLAATLALVAVIALSAAAPGWVLAAGGAQGEDLTAGTSVPVEACELLDPAEVADVMGTPIDGNENVFGSVFQDQTGWLSECIYMRQRDTFVTSLDVTVAGGPGYESVFEDLRTGPYATPIEGLGDDAVLRLPPVWGLDQPAGSLFVRVGDTYLGLSLGIVDMTRNGALVQVGDGEAQTAILLDLAKIALGRLGGGTGPGPEPSPSPNVPPICDMLGLADAESIVGRPLADTALVAENEGWGPACHYRNEDDDVLLFLGVWTGPDAVAHFEGCPGEPVLGVGEAAIIGAGPAECRSVYVGSYFIEEPLLARSGDTVVTVGAVTEESGGVNQVGSREAQVAIARRILGHLGLDAGEAITPLDPAILEHACSLLSEEELAGIVGASITSTAEYQPSPSYPKGGCGWNWAKDGNSGSLGLSISAGDAALEEWGSFRTWAKGSKVPVEGLGDEALTEPVLLLGPEHPLVTLWVLVGDGVLVLNMGAEQLPDYTQRAPGTLEEQLAMLRQVAEVILPRLAG